MVYDETEGFFPRAAGFTKNPNSLAFLAFIATTGIFLKKVSRCELILWTITLFFLFIVTQSRGTLMVLSLFILMVKIFSTKNTLHKLILFSTVTAGGSLIMLLMSFMRFGNDVSSGRLENWKLALGLINTHGFGLYFGDSYNQMFEKLNSDSGFFCIIDNTYLTLLVEHGIVGTMLLLSTLVFAIYQVYKYRDLSYKNIEAIIFITFIIAWAVYSGFETVLYKNTFYQSILTFFLLSYSKGNLMANEQDSKETKEYCKAVVI